MVQDGSGHCPLVATRPRTAERGASLFDQPVGGLNGPGEQDQEWLHWAGFSSTESILRRKRVDMSFKAGRWVVANTASPAGAKYEWGWTVGSAGWRVNGQVFSIVCAQSCR